MNILELKMASENPKTVQKIMESKDITITQVMLQKGQVIEEHVQDVTVYIIVQQGEVAFMITGEKVVLNESKILRLDPHERHAVTADTDCSFLIVKVGEPKNEKLHPPVTGK